MVIATVIGALATTLMTNGGCGYRINGAAVITVPRGTIIMVITTGGIGTIDVIN